MEVLKTSRWFMFLNFMDPKKQNLRSAHQM